MKNVRRFASITVLLMLFMLFACGKQTEEEAYVKKTKEVKATGQTGNAFDITVMTYNCLTTSKQPITAEDPDTGLDRGEMLIDHLETYMPDSIGLQEITREWRKYIESNIVGKQLKNGAVYEMSGLVSDDGLELISGSKEYAPILYRADRYEKVKEGGQWYSDTPNVKSKYGPMKDKRGMTSEGMKFERVYGYTVLKNKETGDTYIHVNTHPDHKSGEAVNEKCMEQLAKYLKGLQDDHKCAVVSTGDYNIVEQYNAYRIMADSANGFTNAKYLTDDYSTTSSFLGYGKDYTERKDYVIDHVFVSVGNVGTYKHEVLDNKWFSDHAGVLVKLRINSKACITGMSVNGENIENFASDIFYYEAETSAATPTFAVKAPKEMVVTVNGEVIKANGETSGTYVKTDKSKKKRFYFVVTDEDGSEKAYCIYLKHNSDSF